MIARLTGQLELVGENRAVIAAGPLAYEVMVAPVTVDELRRRLGQVVTLHTLEYFDGNPAYGQMVPRLVGFLTEMEKRFFVRYVSVQGIGIAKGLKSLVMPEINMGQMYREMERAANGQCKTLLVPHCGGWVHDPNDILRAILEGAK
jgi:Holliday junction DNA helicase RuvA